MKNRSQQAIVLALATALIATSSHLSGVSAAAGPLRQNMKLAAASKEMKDKIAARPTYNRDEMNLQ